MSTVPQRSDILNPEGTLCAQCRREVEEDRLIYAVPTCHACLPPPPSLLEKDPHTGRPVSPLGLSLHEALALAEPDSRAFGLKIRIAVSTPDAALVAVQINEGRPRIRKVNTITGRGSSQMDTGEWYDGEGVGYSWRPA